MITRKILKRRLITLLSCLLLFSQITFAEALTELPKEDFAENITYFTKTLENLPNSFNGFKIVHLSDYHNQLYELDPILFIKKIKELNPDIIVLTGDIIDPEAIEVLPKSFADYESVKWMNSLLEIAPVYYIYGNNDTFKDEAIQADYEKYLKELGISLLKESSVLIERQEESIELVGISDPVFLKKMGKNEKEQVEASLDKAFKGTSIDGVKILLAHRPEFIELYSKYKPQLVLSGHTHGGQARSKSGIPYVGIPGQEKPIYIDGLYNVFGTSMIVNRGLGTSQIPIRINCPPEIGVITLKCPKTK